MSKIKSIRAYQILDSRGYPTLEGVLTLDNGKRVVASVPSGTSVGKYEAKELRDGEEKNYDGFGVSRAVYFVNELLAPKLINASSEKQEEIDNWLKKADGTKNKEKLGSNTTLLISLLVVKAAATSVGMPLYSYINRLYKKMVPDISPSKIPTPVFNVINAGMHSGSNLEFQEYQIIPSSSLKFSEALKICVEVYHELGRDLRFRKTSTAVGQEGGYAPNFSSNIDPLEAIQETIVRKNLKSGLDIFFGLDIAASNFFKNGRYTLKEKPHPLKLEEYYKYIKDIVAGYPFLLIEDPFDQDDFGAWTKFSNELSREIYLVGDDLTVSSKERVEKALKEKLCSSILIKPNQTGTITETIETIIFIKKNNMSFVVSHRSGETNDSFIADFAVGVQSDFVKFGAPARGERVAKYNRLLRIEEELKL